MSWRGYITSLSRGASSIGDAARPGTAKRSNKTRGELERDARQAAATSELQATLAGCTTPPNLVLPVRKRKKD